MGGIYYKPNKEVAEEFILENEKSITEQQKKAILSLMKEGSTLVSRRGLGKGSKNIYLESDIVVIETIDESLTKISPLGEVTSIALEEQERN